MQTWIISSVGFATLFLLIAIRTRPAIGICTVLPLSWVIPSWVGLNIGGELLNVKSTVAIFILLAYSILPRATFPRRLIPCDYAVIGLIFVGITSDLLVDGVSWQIFAQGYIEWFLPYLCGRLAFQQREDISYAWPILSIVGMLLAAEAVFEAWSRMNPFEWVFNLRPLDGVSREIQRWNMKRAYGPCLHPLYFGVLLTWFFAWQVHAGWKSLLNRASLAWLFPCLLGAIAPLATGSRGPMIAGGIVFLVILFFSLSKWRWGMVGLAGALTVALFINQERVFGLLDQWSGETDHGRQLKELTIEDKSEKYSSARARLTLFRIYREPLLKAGLLGYGTGAVTDFPINVPLGSEEAQLARDIYSLDNTYMLISLRFGYLGLACFLAMIALSIWQLLRVHDVERGRSIAMFAVCLAGGTVAVAWLIFGVWMPSDYGFAFIWGIGAASGLYYQTFVETSDRKVQSLKHDRPAS